MDAMKLTAPLFVVLAIGASPGRAAPVLGSDLAQFSVLGASTVTNTGATTLTGDLGVSPGSAITGKETITVNGTHAEMAGNPSVHENDATAMSAQTQLAAAKASLALLGPGTLEPADLAGLTLSPGVYTVPAGTSNLSGTLTLDGGGNANAFWVFQSPSTLITSLGSVVDVVNTGAGAGVFWNIGSSATLGAGTSFEGNLLALDSITLGNGVTIGCGRALAKTAPVTLDTNAVSIACLGTGEEGSGGLSGGLSVATPGGLPTPLPFALVPSAALPEPGTLALVGLGLLAAFAPRRAASRR